jgi:factor associated with neutral sphingomyelinase activation
MLRFGGGYYDLPDRIFFSRTLLCANLTALSVNDTWHAVLSNASDEKELIPEFFDGPGDFLVNRLNLPLGIRQDGKEAPPPLVPLIFQVSDVRMPPWASSAPEFVQKSRAALECAFVSSRLHFWIDLVFGFRQTGRFARDADNLFHPLTYQGEEYLEQVHPPPLAPLMWGVYGPRVAPRS